jgi:hypothetical protein
VPLDIVPGGGHQANVWRAALTPMLEWMTPQLATEVQKIEWDAAHRKPPVKHHQQAAKTAKPKIFTRPDLD